MTKKERVKAALTGGDVDRIPVSAWKHFPVDDRDAEGHIRAFLDFQRKYDWDFMKLMFSNSFILEDWGVVFGGYDTTEGYSLTRKYAINSRDDWKKLKVLDPYDGALGELIKVVRGIKRDINDNVFKLATVFCPLMLTYLLAGERIELDFKQNSECVHEGLEYITQSVIKFAVACLESGAEGIFFATKFASTDFMSREEYAEFGHFYNMRVLQAIKDLSHFTMLHICGKNIMFDDFLDYPVDAINWDDRVTEPSLAQARIKTDKCLIGGIDKLGVVRSGKPEDVMKEAVDAISSVGYNKYILAPGCVLPIDTPEENIFALRRSVEKTG